MNLLCVLHLKQDELAANVRLSWWSGVIRGGCSRWRRNNITYTTLTSGLLGSDLAGQSPMIT